MKKFIKNFSCICAFVFAFLQAGEGGTVASQVLFSALAILFGAIFFVLKIDEENNIEKN